MPGPKMGLQNARHNRSRSMVSSPNKSIKSISRDEADIKSENISDGSNNSRFVLSSVVRSNTQHLKAGKKYLQP